MKVLICDRFSITALQRLRTEKNIDVQVLSHDDEIEKRDISDFDVLLIRSRTTVDQKLLDRAKKLKLVITTTSGFDHIDLTLTSKKNIKTCYTPEANAISAAELTWGLIVACTRRFNRAFGQMKSGEWRREPLTGHELYKKTLGIIGLGRVGRRVARVAQAFDMRVVAYDPFIEEDDFKNAGAVRLGWDEVMKDCDILSLHVPLTRETKSFINESTLENLNEGAVLINTSRGKVMNEQHVLQALRSGRISYLGLDVFEKEPLPKSSALLSEPNVILTPHIGANTSEAFERGSQAAVDKVLAFRDGKPLNHELTEKDICQLS